MRHRIISGLIITCADCNALLQIRQEGFAAMLCGANSDGDWFMLKSRVWQQAQHVGKVRFLCTGCVEHRIGRKLTADDFRRDAKVNFGGRKPAKLRHRMRGLKPAKRLVETRFTP
jgi:hypothetical protein